MLNTFPTLLNFTFFAPTLLRVAAGLVFVYVAYTQWQRREELSRLSYPIVGGGMWTVWLFILFGAITSVLLIIGLFTQIVAILGMLGALKFFFWQKRYPRAMVLSRPASALLFIICLSLLITGAGTLAFDVPL